MGLAISEFKLPNKRQVLLHILNIYKKHTKNYNRSCQRENSFLDNTPVASERQVWFPALGRVDLEYLSLRNRKYVIASHRAWFWNKVACSDILSLILKSTGIVLYNYVQAFQMPSLECLIKKRSSLPRSVCVRSFNSSRILILHF